MRGRRTTGDVHAGNVVVVVVVVVVVEIITVLVVKSTTIPTSPVLSLLRIMFAS